MLDSVHCTYNENPISVVASHADGAEVEFTIEAKQALIDRDGCLRFFCVDWGERGIAGYKLHPYYTHTDDGIHWILEFLAGFGLSRIGARIVKGKTHVDNLGRYFTFSDRLSPIIKSFMPRRFEPEHLGYHNIETDKLIFLGPLYLKG